MSELCIPVSISQDLNYTLHGISTSHAAYQTNVPLLGLVDIPVVMEMRVDQCHMVTGNSSCFLCIHVGRHNDL